MPLNPDAIGAAIAAEITAEEVAIEALPELPDSATIRLIMMRALARGLEQLVVDHLALGDLANVDLTFPGNPGDVLTLDADLLWKPATGVARLTATWLYDADTVTAPPAGYLGFDHAEAPFASVMRISKVAQEGPTGVLAMLQALAGQIVRVRRADDAWALYRVGAVADHDAHVAANVSFIRQDNPHLPFLPGNGEPLSVTVSGEVGEVRLNVDGGRPDERFAGSHMKIHGGTP